MTRRPSPEVQHYPRCLDPEVAAAVDALDGDAREFFEERAGIIEYDGGIPRIEAEEAALEQTRAWMASRPASAG